MCGNRHYAKKYGTVGPPAKHQEFLLVDEDGNAVAQGEEGEVTLGGPQCAKASMTAEGVWEDLDGKRVRLGDLAVMDDEGFITVTGRLKDLIIRGGVKYLPRRSRQRDDATPESLRSRRCRCTGLDLWRRSRRLYCRPGWHDSYRRRDQRPLRGNLADYRLPKQFHFIDALPKNDRGKVRRPDLQEMWNRLTRRHNARPVGH